MILPIVAYGDPVLKKKAQEVDPLTPEIKKLAENMFETMYNASGVGLAAPQIGQSIRLFVVDGSPMADEDEPEFEFLQSFKKVFVNPTILEESGEEWPFTEGCLSIPDIREDVYRKPNLTIKYQDLEGQWYQEDYTGIAARIIQHEYDHIEGILFTDHLSGLKKRLLQGRLQNILKGRIRSEYRMKFAQLK